MVELLFTLFVIVAIAYFVRKYGRFVYLSSKIPGPSMWELLTVHARHLLSDKMLTHTWKMCESHDFKPFAGWLYSNFVGIVSDQDTISKVFNSKNLLDKPSWVYSLTARYLGNGLATLNGEEYRRHRKIMSPGFHKSLLAAQLPTVNKDATTLVEEMRTVAESTGSVELHPLLEVRLLSLSFSIITSGAYVSPKIKTLMDALKMCTSLVHLRVFNPFYYWFLKIFSTSFRQTEAMAVGILEDAREEECSNLKDVAATRLCEDGKPSSFNEILLRSNMNGEQRLSEEECFDETKTILAASSETTAVGTSAVLLMLALHQDVQQRVFDEMESILGQNHRSVEMEDIPQMVYLDMVVKEALRLFPPIPFIGRNVEKETDLDGVILPKGTFLMVNIFALHRNPNAFEDPLKFDPERFSPEMCDKRHPYAYIPFSSGFRKCPGQLQAMIMIKTFLCHIVRNFKVLPSDGIKCMDDVHVKVDVVLHLSEYSLRFVSREIK